MDRIYRNKSQVNAYLKTKENTHCESIDAVNYVDDKN